MGIKEVRDSIEKFISENKKEEIEKILTNPETDTSIREIYSILTRPDPDKLEILRILNSNSSSYITYLAYAEYLVRNNKEEESVEYYQGAIKMCTDSGELPEIIKTLTFIHLHSRDIEKAFYTGWSLIGMHPTRNNLRLVGYICDLIDKSNLPDKIKKESKKTKQIIDENIPPVNPKGTETVRGKDIEVIGNLGIEGFLALYKIDIQNEFEVGFEDNVLLHADLIEGQKYPEFFKIYHKTILSPKNRTDKPVEVDVFNYLIETEDISLLYKIANDLYKNSYYISSSTLFKILIDLFSRMHHLRLKFMRVNNSSMNSRIFSEIFRLSPHNCKLYREIVKKHNLSVFIVSKGKSKEHYIDTVLLDHFNSKVSHSHYVPPRTHINPEHQ